MPSPFVGVLKMKILAVATVIVVAVSNLFFQALNKITVVVSLAFSPSWYLKSDRKEWKIKWFEPCKPPPPRLLWNIFKLQRCGISSAGHMCLCSDPMLNQSLLWIKIIYQRKALVKHQDIKQKYWLATAGSLETYLLLWLYAVNLCPCNLKLSMNLYSYLASVLDL